MNVDSMPEVMVAVAEHRSLPEVLRAVANGIAGCKNVVLARIWLYGPGDQCASCRFADECTERERCLHLVASAGNVATAQSDPQNLIGGFRRFPNGQRKIGRIAAGVVVIFAIIYGYFGATIEYAFSSDPIGPRGFPLGLAVALLLLGGWYWAKPGASEEWPEREGQIAAISFLLISAATVLAMDWIGFVPAMVILMTAIARLFSASWPLAILNGVVQALLWWVLFGPLLGGTLPKGPLGF